MVFKLLYRRGSDSQLSCDSVDVDNFADLFTAAECRLWADHCRVCNILSTDMKSLAFVRWNAIDDKTELC
jgi:hypothetical protein